MINIIIVIINIIIQMKPKCVENTNLPNYIIDSNGNKLNVIQWIKYPNQCIIGPDTNKNSPTDFIGMYNQKKSTQQNDNNPPSYDEINNTTPVSPPKYEDNNFKPPGGL